MKQWVASSLALLLGWAVVVSAQETRAACTVEASESGKGGALVTHLASSCTSAEREAHAVGSAAIMEAVAKGRPVDLVGVIVRGDLLFDSLAVQTTQSAKGLTSEQQAALNQLHVEELRLVREAVTIRDSVVLGAVRHRSARGTLQFEGPIDFHRTTFKGGVDLSRSVFQGGVELSGATFEKEAYFVQGEFAHAVGCQETKFGPHTRFHRSTFRGPVDCADALFDGLAEFLETSFDQPISFERARFGLGTGFSGSRFKQRADFSEAIFSREAFFGFSVFEGETVFANAQFLGRADFSDAEFKKPDDLAKVRFDQPPLFTRIKRVVQDQPTDFLKSSASQYTVTLLLLLMAAVLVAYAL
ncbi:MAG: pentapeptide repeat-containing protein, partial [Nitrospirae bacterium]|nr:pentapeptide repeat-containing protein [Nitrospirota bacterium]